MKNTTRLLLILILFATSYAASAQNNFWTDVSESAMGLKRDPSTSLPKQYRTLRLDTASLILALRTAPREFTEAARNTPLVLVFPMPDGSFKRFKVVETSIMEPALAAKFPGIKTYGGAGIDDPYASIKIDLTALGFHAMILSQINGSVFIDPFSEGNLVSYISYNKKDVAPKTPFIEKGLRLNNSRSNKGTMAHRTNAAACIGGTLRRYRLAVACTWQYAVAVAGKNVTTAQALSAIVTSVNRVDGVYETEVDIRMVLVGNNNKIVFTDSASQPFTGNDDPTVLIDESQAVIDANIGSANYDIGHTFSTGAGGYAGVGVVCDNIRKALGVTGSPRPIGDPYNIDYVAHEIGHEFGANHTFNASTGNCGGGNGNSSTNAEPGSGVTIMGYAGICDASNNVQANSIPYFHALSFDEITNYSDSANGNSCAVLIATGNKPPVVNAGNDYAIPKSTPFMLTGSATDPDADALTYSWEEINVGGPFGDWNRPAGDAPVFRSFAPVTTPTRYFPQLSDQQKNTTTIGEILPSYARTLRFRLTVRDNKAGGGGVCSDEANVTIAGQAGPFVVTSPNTAIAFDAGSFTRITWDVANTNAAPVNCSNVILELSTDGGLTFPITLLANTPNDGEEEIVVPNNPTTRARVRVRAVGNIFYDISNVDFTINANTASGFAFSNPLPVVSCNNSSAGTIINTNPLNNFSTPVTLSASGNPAGTSVVFSANPVAPGSKDSITIKGAIPAGLYNITITGTAGSVVRTRVIQFMIGAPTKASLNTSPLNNVGGVSLIPKFSWTPSANAPFYTLTISTSSTFASTVQTIDNIADSTYTLTTPLAPNTEYFWRVIPRNICGPGNPSAGSLFKTVAIVCSDAVFSKNVPRIIDTVAATTVTSTLAITGGGTIQDVNVVGLKGKHTFVSDLVVSLVSPSNTTVQLFAETCYGDANFNLNFDDETANDIACPLDSLQTAKPFRPLSVLQNESSTGTWKLLVEDLYDSDGGSLESWGLRICTYQATTAPVNRFTFSATESGTSALLQWTALNEVTDSSYEIERSTDENTFNKIGTVNAKTSAVSLQQYLFTDFKPLLGDNYYRLKRLDKGGNYNYSSTIKLNFDKVNNAEYVVYPNPAVDKITLRILSPMKPLAIRLLSASGQTVYQKSVGSVTGGEQFDIPVKGVGKGFYVLSLYTEKGIANEKIIVQ